MQMNTYANLIATIGNTPLVELTHLDTGPCQLFAKLECQNPGGSIKDRIAVTMIETAERAGALRPGGLIVEATAGNTGLGLALIAAVKGYKLCVVMPDKMSEEKLLHLKALGATVIITRSDVVKGDPDYYQDLAERIVRETPGAYYINQFANPANPLTHETTTGPEIWEQMQHQLDAIVVGVGSGGTLTGLGRFMHHVAPQVKMILADPQGSILAPYHRTGQFVPAGQWLVEGIGEDFIPINCDLSLVSEAITVTDPEAIAAARLLLNKEGIFGGSSTGTLLHAALDYCRRQTEPKRVVTLVCDTGNKYLSKIYSDHWLKQQGISLDYTPRT